MLKITALAIATTALAISAQAGTGPRDQLLANVTYELPDYVKDVDPDSLSRHQLAVIYAIMHDGHTDTEKRRMIRSVIGGRHSLRGVFFN